MDLKEKVTTNGKRKTVQRVKKVVLVKVKNVSIPVQNPVTIPIDKVLVIIGIDVLHQRIKVDNQVITHWEVENEGETNYKVDQVIYCEDSTFFIFTLVLIFFQFKRLIIFCRTSITIVPSFHSLCIRFKNEIMNIRYSGIRLINEKDIEVK